MRATPVEVGREPSLIASTAVVCVGKGDVVCVRDGGEDALDVLHLLRKLRSAQVSKTNEQVKQRDLAYTYVM